ncbi:MAG TPA: ABC transporter ATP-binding protein, partial [Acidimicrobiales bacterium]|nr:ABC transporter ATP-binding protein [Acidimicrobiales bacterium]
SIFGESVERACEQKHIGFVSQSPALLPWRTVLENVRLPLEVNRRAGEDRQAEHADPRAILAAFGLSAVLDKRPHQLSGGMQQRVAIARAFAFRPAVLLMDEPFSSLDELTREVLRDELLDLWEQSGTTIVFVTHSIPEAVLLSDQVVVMAALPGRIGDVIDVDLPRPRGDLVELSGEFREVERHVRLELRRGWRHGAA